MNHKSFSVKSAKTGEEQESCPVSVAPSAPFKRPFAIPAMIRQPVFHNAKNSPRLNKFFFALIFWAIFSAFILHTNLFVM
jgi:hypothetical protein